MENTTFENSNTAGYIEGKPNNNMTLAIIATVLGCCSPCFIGVILGGIGIYFASTVNSKLDLGDFEAAKKAAKNAKILSYIAIGLMVFNLILNGIMFAVQGDDYMDQYMEMMEQIKNQ